MNQSVSTTKKDVQKAGKPSTAGSKVSKGFTAEERAAVRARARELKASEDAAEARKAVLEEIARMLEPDRLMAERLHAIIMASVPALSPRLWYGQPAYYKDGKMICFFQSTQKFKTRYATLGFSDTAKLDEGDMWPTYYALNKLTAAVEARISALVKKAVS